VFIYGLAAWLESTIEDQVTIVDDALAFFISRWKSRAGRIAGPMRPRFSLRAGDADCHSGV
jgi:hypothetical protein